MIRETMLMTLRVKKLEDALASVSEACRIDG
jgi:hypothetical protein